MVTHTKIVKKKHKNNDPICVGCTLELPSEFTKVGLTGDQKAIAIMLILENRKPHQTSKYNPVETEESMRLMRQVLINRLKDPGNFKASGAKTTTDIIRGKGQFRGLENYPKTISTITHESFKGIIKEALEKSNPSYFGASKNYVMMAIKIAALDENSIKASIPEVIGWRTSGADKKPPGKGNIWIKDIAGNHFYIKDPHYDSSKKESPKKKKPTSHAKKLSSSKKYSASKATGKHKK